VCDPLLLRYQYVERRDRDAVKMFTMQHHSAQVVPEECFLPRDTVPMPSSFCQDPHLQGNALCYN
jgi:hypothetical protein